MNDDEQQFSLRWHNHQNSVIGALGHMLNTELLTDVTLSASGTTVKAHKLILASCSQYFAQLFKEVDTENNTLVVVLGCDAMELKLLLTFMYTGEVTASKKNLPSLLRLAQTLKVSGLTDADTNSTLTTSETEISQEYKPTSPIDLENKFDPQTDDNCVANDNIINKNDVAIPTNDSRAPNYNTGFSEFLIKNENDRLSKLDQIVKNLYSTHKIGNQPIAVPFTQSVLPNLEDPDTYGRKWRSNNSVCTVCNKRLSNQYNLRVHMETHSAVRHACRACTHVSRSRDALRKHVAYRHAPPRDSRPDLGSC